ncbi:MAG: HRDC domain-containing protein [Anaerolineaceae bacterium]|nr:HRDC domain-containing protein [Anaerolineaceae bacterium]
MIPMQSMLIALPVWVDTPDALLDLVKTIQSDPILAVDTESNSLYAYQEQVCLIQISTPSTDYLIDPLALDDLTPLAPLFANPRQQKIFHAAEYDLICLKRDYGFQFANLFDTMIAARILGETQVGLGSLLGSSFSINLDKRYQRANWGKRPLPPAMLDYARMDTHYLFQLKDLLAEELEVRALLDLAREDFALVCDVEPSSQAPNGNSCWKVAGNARLNPQETAILHSLCSYRDQQARSLDLPHFKVLSNEALVEISRAAPHSIEELRQIRGLSERLINRYAEGLLKAIAVGENNPPPARPYRAKPDNNTLKRLAALHTWRKNVGQSLHIESDVVLPRNFMESIAMQNPTSLGELKQLMDSIPWRFQQYGEAIFQVLHTQE